MAVSLVLAAAGLVPVMGLFLPVCVGIPIKAFPHTYASGTSTFSGSRVFPAFSRMVPHSHMLEVTGVSDTFLRHFSVHFSALVRVAGLFCSL